MAAQKMATEFFVNFNTRLTQRQAVEVARVVIAPPSLFARLLAWFKRLFGG
jgi:hypothetical protein